MAEERTEAEQAADTAGSDSKRLVRERSCDVFSAPHSGNAGGGPVDIYWEYQSGRPAHKFTRAIKCF